MPGTRSTDDDQLDPRLQEVYDNFQRIGAKPKVLAYDSFSAECQCCGDGCRLIARVDAEAVKHVNCPHGCKDKNRMFGLPFLWTKPNTSAPDPNPRSARNTGGAVILKPSLDQAQFEVQVERELLYLKSKKEAARRLRVEDATDSGDPGTWTPVDLVPYLNGEHVAVEPTVGLSRSDGIRLLYPGREHSVIGEMETGKSWFAVACAAAEIHAEGTVLYLHFEEADPSGTMERLVALGVSHTRIVKQFLFIGPGAPITPEDTSALTNRRPSLVIVDGVNEAMSLHGWGIRDEDGVALMRRQLIKPLKAAGATVVQLDHVVKDRDNRGRGLALGSVHKGNGLDGSLILLEAMEPFGRGQKGASAVYVTKDRPGWLRQHGRPDKKIPHKTFMGVLAMDDTRTFVDYTDLSFFAPKPDTEIQDVDEALDSRILGIIRVLEQEAATDPERTVNTNTIVARSGVRRTAVMESLERLNDQRRVNRSTGVRNSRIYSVTGSEDQLAAP